MHSNLRIFFTTYFVDPCNSGLSEKYFQLGSGALKLGAFVAVNQEEPLWIESFHNWPLGYYGKRVVVTGIVIIKHDLLVFIQKEAEPQVTGVPVAEGTDLHLKRKRYLLKNATWNLIE